MKTHILVATGGSDTANNAIDLAADLVAKFDVPLTADDDPADGILDMAEKVGAGMIVIGHRGLGRVRSLLAGSVAKKVNNKARCTVVTVR